jgi:hypothetical protein
VNVLIISPTTDFAGVGINLKHAFDEFSPTWHARHVVRKASPYGYPMDFVWPRRDRAITEQVRVMFKQADIVHVMDKPNVLTHFHRANQRFVVQHLGTRYREAPEQMTAQSRMYDAIEITDSIDLLLFPHVRFVPVAVDTRALLETRLRVYQPSDVIRIAHAPTDRSTSDTDVVLATIERLSREFPIEFDLIEDVSNKECIERKARADIYIDRMGIGFGVNAIECWAMGIPVVSGFSDPAFTERARLEFGDLPWVNATRDSMYDVVRMMVASRAKRTEYGWLGQEHADRWHSQEAVLAKVTAIYDEALQAVAA